MKASRLQSSLGWLAAGLASLSSAQVTYTPGPSYSIGIPSGSSISSSSTGALYFQISAATTYQWVGLGIGSSMSGATIFVMYQDGNGNVTISGRKGTGEVEPQEDSTIQSGLTLLAGSGVSGGKMVANVKCTSCTLQSDASSSSSPWIAAWKSGSSLATTSTSASITEHSEHRQVKIDLSKASISSDSNPFVSSSSTASTTTGSGSTATTSAGSTATSSSSNDGDGDNDSSSGVVESGADSSTVSDYQKAHGIIMGVVVVLLLPLGAMFMRLGGSAIVHGILQLLSICAMIVGLGLGIKLADLEDEMFNNTHTIFGIVIIGLFVLQPVFGIIHHIQYKRNLARAGVSHVHIWYGRVLMILAVINGGLGLKLSDNTKGGKIAYAVVAGVIGLAYIAMVLFKRKSGGSIMSSGSRKSEEPMSQPVRLSSS